MKGIHHQPAREARRLSMDIAKPVHEAINQLARQQLQTPSTWHWFDAAQVFGFPPMQVPAWHVSVWVQAFPSLQGVWFGLFVGAVHCPVAGTHEPAIWHWPAEHWTGLPPTHVPAWQVSV